MAALNIRTALVAAPFEVDWDNGEETGDEFINNGKTLLIVNNTDLAEALTVTVVSQNTLRGLAVQDPSITLAGGGDSYGVLGPFPAALFNDADGNTAITYSSASFGARILAVSIG